MLHHRLIFLALIALVTAYALPDQKVPETASDVSSQTDQLLLAFGSVLSGVVIGALADIARVVLLAKWPLVLFSIGLVATVLGLGWIVHLGLQNAGLLRPRAVMPDISTEITKYMEKVSAGGKAEKDKLIALGAEEVNLLSQAGRIFAPSSEPPTVFVSIITEAHKHTAASSSGAPSEESRELAKRLPPHMVQWAHSLIGNEWDDL